jgi:S1-C subfamily serine protease
MSGPLEQLSDAVAEQVARAAPSVVAIHLGRRHCSGIVWRPDVVVTSEQVLPSKTDLTLTGPAGEIQARLAGRDPSTNVAVLQLAQPLQGTRPDPAPVPRVGAMALMLGADRAGAATARLALVHATGPEWHSMRGGRIDALLRLDARLGADEGGPVLDAAGRLLGMSTAGPRWRTLVIPAATVERPLLSGGRIARGWLGLALQPVAIPQGLRAAAGQEAGMMVMSLATDGPAEKAGVLPGDILLDVDGTPTLSARALAAKLGPDRVGQTAQLRLLRAGAAHTLSAVVAPRPA